MINSKKLTLAEYNELGKTIREAVEAEKPLDHYIEKYDMCLVTLACVIPQPNHLKVLKEMFADREAVDLNSLKGINPLKVAMSNENYSAIKILLYYGADFNIKDDEGEYLIHRIVEQNTWFIVRHILAFDSVDLTVLNDRGETPMEHAETACLDLVYEELQFYEKRKKWGALFSDDEKDNYKGIDDLSDLEEQMKELDEELAKANPQDGIGQQ